MDHIKFIENLIANPKKYVKNFSNEELVNLLKMLSDVYYNTENAIVPDETYDKLIDILKNKDPTNEYLKNIGAPIRGTKEKVSLPFEMGSLSKIKPDQKYLEIWKKKYRGPWFISDKLDGSSAQVYKNQNNDIFMFSRGDGYIGQNISHLLKYLVKKETTDLLPVGTSVRGEIIISKENFKNIKGRMKNARSAGNGLVNSKNVDTEIANIAEFVTYAVLNPCYDYETQMKLLKEWKFKVVEHQFVEELTETLLIEWLIKRKMKSEYEMDGIVCVDCSQIYQHKGGYQDHEFAFKINEQMAITNVIDVIWEPSKDGYLKPRIKIEPVELGGTTVTYATAFNAKYIIDNKIGCGAKIKIVRSGDVIPYILEIIEGVEPSMPLFPYKWNSTGVDLILQDENNANGQQIVTIKLLVHFFAKIKVKYMSEGIITKLVENGYNSIPSILTAEKKNLLKIDGIGEKLIDKIYLEIDRAFSKMTLANFMAASNKLGRGLGERKLAEIIRMYPNILKEPEEGLYNKIIQVSGFSDITANLFVRNLKSFKKFYKEIAKIKDLKRFQDIVVQKLEGKFNTQIFVFTGVRDKDLEKYITENGGKITESISQKTTMLIHADNIDTTTNKFIKAKELGVKTISISEFMETYVT